MVDTWSIGTKKNYIKVAPSKEVTFMKDVIFYKTPSYFKAGTAELKLQGLGTGVEDFNKEPSYGKLFKAKTRNAEVPDVPISSEDSLGTTSSSQPLVAFHSQDDVSIRLRSQSTSTQPVKESYVEFRSQKKNAWRMAVHSDGDMYLTFHSAPGDAAGIKAIRLTRTGAVHFYGAVHFGGKTRKKF